MYNLWYNNTDNSKTLVGSFSDLPSAQAQAEIDGQTSYTVTLNTDIGYSVVWQS